MPINALTRTALDLSDSICTCDVTREPHTGPLCHCLVLQNLGKLGRPLHLELQRLEGVLCFRGQGGVWDSARAKGEVDERGKMQEC